MAARKSLELLPLIFQTDANQKFLSATIDQLISEPELKNVNGYIGRKFAPTFKAKDSYIIENDVDRQNYQLEPSIVVRNDRNEVTFFATYIDFLNKVEYYGGFVDNHSRLFNQEYYSFDPGISYDKFVNFSQYYWLPNGPDPVTVNAGGVELTKTYNVTRNVTANRYDFSSNDVKNNTLILARGGVYTFSVNQSGVPFWIQSELGTDGRLNAANTISTREVLGVENNGEDVGDIVFTVPQKDAQDRFVSMNTVFNVDYAVPFFILPYSNLQNKFLDQFLADYPQYAGIVGSLDGKFLAFIDQTLANNFGEEAWTSQPVIDPDGNVLVEYGSEEVVPDNQRGGIWKVQLIDLGFEGNPLVRLLPVQDVAINEKIYVKYGVGNANREFYKDVDGFFYRVPPLTALQDTLYIQDGVSSRIYAKIKLVDPVNSTIDVETDILGQSTYTSPNGVKFTSGLKIEFSTDVLPEKYQNKQYYVENVGDSIRLVDITWLVTPEVYNDENAVNYPLRKVVISKPTTAAVPVGTVISVGNTTILINTETPAGKTELITLDAVDEIEVGMAVAGDGIASGTSVVNVLPETAFPEYITIKRDALDVNAWARNNRWFHSDVIKETATYNGTTLAYDQKLRAQRPIIQFENDYQLVNNGRIGKQPIDILDTTTTDPFNALEGKVLTTAFGVELVDSQGLPKYPNGLRVLFGAAVDPLVRDKIYIIDLVQYEADPTTGISNGDYYINLTIAEDGDSQIWDTVVVTEGQYRGSQWWYDGTQWLESQQKLELQQDPLFAVHDATGKSLIDYTNSTFVGTKLFGYVRNTSGPNDSVLGFPLRYRNFGTQGDIEFQNYFETDTFTYTENGQTITQDVSVGFLRKIVDRETTTHRNVWRTAVEESKQYQQINFVFDGTNAIYELDIEPAEEVSIPYVKVFQNNAYLESTNWTLEGKTLTITSPTLVAGDRIDIIIYSNEISGQGFFEVPDNLNFNAQNTDLSSLTLGQLRNHLVELSQNSTDIEGSVLGSGNLRDVEIKSQGGTILQHSAPTPYSMIFLLDETVNFVNALRLAQQEYAKFKNKFLELSISLQGIQPTDPVASVDLILTSINSIKNATFPWYYSDMVPYGTLKNVINYTIFNPLVRSYEITNVFADEVLGNRAVIIYHNGVQLIKGLDYTFDTDRPAITFTDRVNLEVDDLVDIVEYQNTDGSYIPETPSKLGLYPKFVPEIYTDDTYRNAIDVIRGHDGSITPAFGDYRDDFLLELEKRIYNNIKIPDNNGSFNKVYQTLPGKFRNSEYTITEFNQLLSKSFLNWIGNNKLDYSTNETFLSEDAFTWNYSRFVDRIDQENLPGSWRACYEYFYDTTAPHLRPWEMLGFAIKPDWWEGFYGPAPYTGGNTLLWDDLELGLIREGERAGINEQYARPGLSTIIPVDVNGFLKNPAGVLTQSFNGAQAATSWAVGQLGPVEWAWRTSSDYPFAMQLALALAEPAKYFSLFVDTFRYRFNTELNQYLTTDGNHHIRQTDINYNGNTDNGQVVRTSGYINWIADYLRNQGINPGTKILPLLQNYEVNLAYKLAGFSDKKYVQVLAEQSSPTSTNDSVLIPNENYDVHLYKSTPVDKIVYSAVIVEKTTNGYSVRGYNIGDPYFTIIPSVANSNAYKITVLNSEGVIFRDYQNLKLTVPYGYEFKSQQQLVDFLISYERYLLAQGFTFNDMDSDLGEIRNFKLSVKEFLFWAQQGWKAGSILVLSPVANKISAVTVESIVDGITDSQYGSKVIDQNFKLIKNNNYNVVRSATDFSLTLTDSASVIALVELNLVQYEHVLVFDNTTVFNDIIYKPELGNRQYRLKLVGQKTDNWDGSLSAPGFIYNSATVPAWQSGKDYLKGELITFKNQYYVALQNVVASTEFAFVYWKQIDANSIKTGLLPNFSTLGVRSQSFYDSYGYFNDADQVKYSHGLIGFKPRQYLDDLGINETTQIELYKGYIKQKGTANAVKQLTKAEFNNLSSAINYYEEWAVRVGEYGALDTNPYVEIALDEKEFSVNPATAEFVPGTDTRGDGLTIFNKSQLYKSTDQYTGKIALNRDDASNYDNDIPTCGYVNIDDVSTTLFDLADYTELNVNLPEIGTGYTIWVAKDFSQDWNVFRVTETDNHIISVTNSLDGLITFKSKDPHNLNVNDLFVVKGFSSVFDGFYQVVTVVDLNQVLVAYTTFSPDLIADLTTEAGFGMLFKLDSLRFVFMEDCRVYGLDNPKHKWKVGEKVWIDLDAPTSFVQGQPFESGNNLWKVYEKTEPWSLKQRIDKLTGDYTSNDGFGSSLKLSDTQDVIVVGSPTRANTGAVSTFIKNSSNVFAAANTITPLTANTISFGHLVDLATTPSKHLTLAVSSPNSFGNVGYVHIYNKALGANNFSRGQVIVGNVAAPSRFGYSFAFDEPGYWLYIGAPDEDKVYVYGLNRNVAEETQTVSVTSSSNVGLSFTPAILDDASSLVITSPTKTYIPNIDYKVYKANARVIFNTTITANLTITQGPYYTPVTTVTGPTGSEFGYAVDSSYDGAQLAVGTPNDTVNVGVFTTNIGTTIERSIPVGVATANVLFDGNVATLTSYTEYTGAGSVFVYDRVIEAFRSVIDADAGTNGQDYTTRHNMVLPGNPGSVYRVTIDDIETTEYFLVDSNTIRFVNPPPIGKVIYIETNRFNLLEKLIGIDSLAGGLAAIQNQARFGTALTICSNNCAIYVGAPNFDNGTQYNTGAVWKFHNRGRLYGTNTGDIRNPVFNIGDTIRLDNFEVAITGTTLDDVVDDINNANLLGITAENENGFLRIDSDKTVAKNLLRILSGSNSVGNPDGVSNVYDAAGLVVFAFMQIILTPYNNSGEHFGNKVILAPNAYSLLISSDRGTTREFTTFDTNTTILDDTSTRFFDSIIGSGSAYIYELYDDPRDAVEDPGRYAYAQQLIVPDLDGNLTTTSDRLNTGDRFGAAIDIIGTYAVVSAPADDVHSADAGAVYLFETEAFKRGWTLIRYQQDKVDIESVNRIFLYDNTSNTILANLEFIDPAKGKVLGAAEQEITYKTAYDPAYYNRGTGERGNINENLYWTDNQVGQVWWNLDRVRYIDYEQSNLTYRSINWGRLFPGSVIEVCEWVESPVPPSQYVNSGFDGVPKYADDSAYVEVIAVDSVTGTIASKYYFWVVDKTSIDPNNPNRRLPLQAIKDLIENPKNQDIPYAAVVQDNALVVFNVGEYLSATNTILHLDYEVVKNQSIIHSEYELVQAGNPADFIPAKIVNKLIDSLAGIDRQGNVVPDPNLSVADKYGVATRPRQSIFIDRYKALSDMIDYVNGVLIKKPVARQYDLSKMRSAEPQPLSRTESIELGEYDDKTTTEINLDYIDVANLPAGYQILVEADTTQENRWTIYTLQNDKTWLMTRVQSYKTDLFWDYVDWYAEGYGPSQKLDYVVDTLVDAKKLPVAAGEEILVRVTTYEGGGWSMLTVNEDLELIVVGIQDGTMQINNRALDTTQNSGVEVRAMVEALFEDIFVGELQGEFNKLFFVMVNYLLNEQKYVDWIFKTSFISVTHNLRSLTQYPNYVKDNQTYYQDYINEVKPYVTKIREYLINYTGKDEFGGDITDFDLPPYYDTDLNVFRSPSGEEVTKDQQLWATGFNDSTAVNLQYTQWYENRNHQVERIIVENPGRGYTTEPTITIVGGGGEVIPAEARALIDGDTGAVTEIIVDFSGSGYRVTPTVLIVGSHEEPATAYAVLKNNKVRSFDTTLKFDRITYNSVVKEWAANTAYLAGDIITHAVVEGDSIIRSAYVANTNFTTNGSFVTTNLTSIDAGNLANANDRIIGYYQPFATMPARDLKQLVYGVGYPGVQVQGLNYNAKPGFSGQLKANITFNTAITTYVGNVITQPEADILLNFNKPIDANIGQWVTQQYATNTYISATSMWANVINTANAKVFGNAITGTIGNVSNSLSVYLVKVNDIPFVSSANIAINGVGQVDAVYSEEDLVWTNVGIKPTATINGNVTLVEIPITDANVTVTRVYSLNKVEAEFNSTADFYTSNASITSGNIKINGTWVTAYPTTVEYVSDNSMPFDISTFDAVDYDEDGNEMAGSSLVDSEISSQYTDGLLGLRPEDINVDGGQYIDTYSSHAPEELIPGRTYDTLDMRVFTKINGNTTVLGYRIFTNMVGETTFLRITDTFSTSLLSDLLQTDTEIYVADASILPDPSPSNATPGVVFINGERITYYVRDLANNKLSQLRRGTGGTGAATIHTSGSLVVDGSVEQLIPGTGFSNVTLPGFYEVSDTEIVAVGNNYSQGITLTASAPAAGGTTATFSIDVDDNTGSISLVTVTDNGSRYTSTPTLTINKPANASVTVGTLTANIVSWENVDRQLTVDSLINLPIGTKVAAANIAAGTFVEAINANLKVVRLSGANTGTISGTVTFYTDSGNQLVPDTIANVYIGQYVNGANILSNAYVTSIDSYNNGIVESYIITLSEPVTGNVAGSTTFYDAGTGANIIAVASSTGTEVKASLTPTYRLRLSSPITANVGETITQSTTGANVTIMGTSGSASDIVLVSYNNSNAFGYSNVTIEMSDDINTVVGDYLTQASSGANLVVVANIANTSSLQGIRTVLPGQNYSQGVTITVAAPVSGVTAEANVTISTDTGSIIGNTIINGGSGYTAVPSITVNKPANVLVTATAFYSATNTLKVTTTTGIFVGEYVSTANIAPTTKVVAVYSANSNVVLSSSNTGIVSGSVTFFDQGSGAALGAILAGDPTTTNVIARYTSISLLDTGSGNIAVNGIDSNVYPKSVTVSPIVNSNLSVSGGQIGEVYGITTAVVGRFYSQGATISFTAPTTGTTATGTITINPTTGSITANAITNAGSGYTSAPIITINKTANVVTTITAFDSSANVMTVNSTANIYVGQYVNNSNISVDAYVKTIHAGNSNVALSAGNIGTVSIGGNVTFFDRGFGGELVALLRPAIYPYYAMLAGQINSIGNVTIAGNTTLRTSNIWMNPGPSVAADGSGFEGSVTEPVLFLKGQTADSAAILAGIPEGGLVLDNSPLEALTTESGDIIIKE